MTRKELTFAQTYQPNRLLSVFFIASLLSGCGGDAQTSPAISNDSTAQSSNSALPVENVTTEWTNSENPDFDIDQFAENPDLAAVLGDREIPYPVYPNGNHYRVGNEKGLSIIVFETTDTFEQVDAYYQTKAGLPRLSAMNDYVRYSINDEDRDPWETGKPGIVIHEFGSDSEKIAAGADKNSRTNIIMSFD